MNKRGFRSNWVLVEETAGPSTSLRSGRDDKFVFATHLSDEGRVNCRSLGFAPNEQKDSSISIRYWEGETADSSASLGMTKGRDGALLEFGGPTNYPNGCRSFLPLLAAGKSRCSG